MPPEEWGSRFWEWVDVLGHWYFNDDLAQRQVRLHWPTREDFGGREDEFLRVLREWCPLRGPVNVACELSERWDPHSGTVTASWAIPELPRGRHCDRPPYLPYLVAFAMAWETEGDFEPNAYYPRLNQILGQQQTPISSGSFQRANDLWADLEHWANNIMDGEIGVFTAVSLGGMEHIGYPMSQVVLKPSERNQLERIFSREGLSPDIALSDSDIQELLSDYRDHFSTRIRHSLDTVGSRFARALFEEVRIELANSSPRDTRDHTGRGRRQAEQRGGQIRLRLACQMGLHSIYRWFFTTASESDDLPDASGQGFAFRPGHVEGVLWQESSEKVATPSVADFVGFAPLGDGLVLQAEDGTPVSWPARGVRFLSPSHEKPGVYVEQEFVPSSSPTIVICGDDEADRMRGIAAVGVPGVSWQGVSAWRVDSPRDLVSMFPHRRNYARRISPIHCIGGVRCHPHASEYFPFALPRVAVDDGWRLSTPASEVSVRPLDEGGFYEVAIDACDPPHAVVLEATREARVRTLTIGVNGSLSVEPRNDPIATEVGSQALDGAAWDAIPAWPDKTGIKEMPLGIDPGCCLLTFLSAWSQCSYGTWTRAVSEIIGSDHNYASRVARGLAATGHASVQADPSTGQWRRLHVCPGRLRRLPWDMDVSGDRFPQAVIEGQLIWTHLETALKSLPYDVDFDITPQPVPYLPPRVRLYSLDSSSLKDAAGQMGLYYQEGSSRDSLENVTEDQLDELEWHDGLITPSDGVLHFSPLLLDDVDARGQRFEDLCRVCGSLLLATQTESYGARHYYLCDLDRSRRTMLMQGTRQWARWLCYVAAVKRFFAMKNGPIGNSSPCEIAMPYVSGTGQVLLPYGLIPPPAATKSLVACTGLLPTIIWDGVLVDAVGSLDKSSVDSFSQPFVVPRGSGQAVFSNVSMPIAKSVLGTLGVTLLEFDIGVSDGSSH